MQQKQQIFAKNLGMNAGENILNITQFNRFQQQNNNGFINQIIQETKKENHNLYVQKSQTTQPKHSNSTTKISRRFWQNKQDLMMLFFLLKYKHSMKQQKNDENMHLIGVYKRMSLFIKSQDAASCQKHHRTLMKKYGSNDGIIQYFQKYLVYDQKEVYEIRKQFMNFVQEQRIKQYNAIDKYYEKNYLCKKQTVYKQLNIKLIQKQIQKNQIQKLNQLQKEQSDSNTIKSSKNSKKQNIQQIFIQQESGDEDYILDQNKQLEQNNQYKYNVNHNPKDEFLYGEYDQNSVSIKIPVQLQVRIQYKLNNKMDNQYQQNTINKSNESLISKQNKQNQIINLSNNPQTFTSHHQQSSLQYCQSLSQQSKQQINSTHNFKICHNFLGNQSIIYKQNENDDSDQVQINQLPKTNPIKRKIKKIGHSIHKIKQTPIKINQLISKLNKYSKHQSIQQSLIVTESKEQIDKNQQKQVQVPMKMKVNNYNPWTMSEHIKAIKYILINLSQLRQINGNKNNKQTNRNKIRKGFFCQMAKYINTNKTYVNCCNHINMLKDKYKDDIQQIVKIQKQKMKFDDGLINEQRQWINKIKTHSYSFNQLSIEITLPQLNYTASNQQWKLIKQKDKQKNLQIKIQLFKYIKLKNQKNKLVTYNFKTDHADNSNSLKYILHIFRQQDISIRTDEMLKSKLFNFQLNLIINKNNKEN